MHGVRDHAIDMPGHVLLVWLAGNGIRHELIARLVAIHLMLQPRAQRLQLHARRIVADTQLLAVIDGRMVTHRHLHRRFGHAVLRQNERLALMGRPPGHHAGQHVDFTFGKPGVVL